MISQVTSMSVAVSYPHVVSTPSLFQGEPHIERLRIRVRDIVLARDQGGSIGEIIRGILREASQQDIALETPAAVKWR